MRLTAFLLCGLSLCPLVTYAAQNIRATGTTAALVKKRTSTRPALTQNVSASLSDGGRAALVHFATGGRQYKYELSLFSVYADGAKARAYANGEAEELSTKPSQTFKSRADGKWASAMLHDDGSISGLFEHAGNFIELKPPEATSLLASPDGTVAAHRVWYHAIQGISLPLPAHAKSSLLEKPAVEKDEEEPRKIIDEDHIDANGVHHIFEVPPGADKPSDEFGEGVIRPNALDKWWPGCYPGDSARHKFVLGVVGDFPAFEEYGAKLQSELEVDVTEASLVYEKQLNIRLEIGELTMYKTASGAPPYAVGCGSGKKKKKFMDQKLDALPDSSFGATHLFTGCGDGYGVVGIAWYGTICEKLNTGVNQLRTENSWLTFAHELGHNFHGDHSFEEGQGKTGGIMDYGDGKLGGTYQFHTKYRKGEMCKMMSKVVDKCNGKFAKASDGPPGGGGGGGGSPRRRRSPSPGPSPVPTPRPGKGGKGGKGGDTPSPAPKPSPTPKPPSPTPKTPSPTPKPPSPEPKPPSPTPEPPSPTRRRSPSRRRSRRRRRRRSSGSAGLGKNSLRRRRGKTMPSPR